MTTEQIAEVCHEANRGYQSAQPTPGIPVAPCWADFPEDQKTGVVAGVNSALWGATPEELHQSWCDFKAEDGWVYGEVKDADKKTHPCLVPYDKLPDDQKVKDRLFKAIVGALS